MRVLSWNIGQHGLRGLLEKKETGNLEKLLDSLGADIIALQEHKLRRDDVDSSVLLAAGWESFFAFNRQSGVSKGYSGTATFVRHSVGMPVAAREGITGSLQLDRSVVPKSRAPEVLGFPWNRYSPDDLEKIDAEGRVVFTDHGSFVLFNCYAPAITSEERAQEREAYRRMFLEALTCELTRHHAAGRRVLLVGDLNICPSPLDTAREQPTDERFYSEHWERQWLRGLLQPSAPGAPLFLDTFRLFHPQRRAAYTCWQTASGARVNNYGSRIDFVLAADGNGTAADWVSGGDIMQEFMGSDHCPVWADLQLDRDPGQVDAQGPAAQPPIASSRFLLGCNSTKQATMHSFFKKALPAGQMQPGACSSSGNGSGSATGAPKPKKQASGPRQMTIRELMPSSSDRSSCGTAAEPSSSQQQQQKQWWQRPPAAPLPAMPISGSSSLGGCSTPELGPSAAQTKEGAAAAGAQEETGAGPSCSQPSLPTGTAVLNPFLQGRPLPRCSHNEPCVLRTVKKKGPNKGRDFFVCNRPDGTAPQGRCDFFKWAKPRAGDNTSRWGSQGSSIAPGKRARDDSEG